MTPDELRESITVMQAALDGKEIQWRDKECPDEWQVSKNHYFDFVGNEYRVKPEPIERWVNIYPNGSTTVWAKEEYAKQSLGDVGRTVHMREVVNE